MLGSYSTVLVPNWISDMFKDPRQFLGFVSSTVGLVSYALSSSFPHLYGEWNILKITLYVLVSLIISWIMLFAENLRDWAFLRLKAHVVFLVLMLTSSYSVFSDKDGKPDTLNVISNGAFALMSLSLSRQIELGFESGLSNFFLGCLTVQLMKINLKLTSAAAIFCYLVIVVRFHLDSKSPVEADPIIDNDHLSIRIDEIKRVEEGAEAGEGAHDVSQIEELYVTRTPDKVEQQVLTDAKEEPNGSVTYEPNLSKPFKRKKGTGLKAVLKLDISKDRVIRQAIGAVEVIPGDAMRKATRFGKKVKGTFAKVF